MMDRILLPGLCSVTFRSLGIEAVVEVAAAAGVRGIEWGGDVHVPPGDAAAAHRAAKLCGAAGIDVPSYGSYLRLTDDEDPAAHDAVLDTAAALGAANIRVWAGRSGPETVSAEMRTAMAERLRRLADAAAGRGVSVSLEYHRRTLTETAESTMALIEATGHPNVFSYWQPVPTRDEDNWLSEIDMLRPVLSHLHVFHWLPGDERRPLREGEEYWRRLMSVYAPGRRWKRASYAFLEFVMDNSVAQFHDDVAVLNRILGG